jgi:hypothetical protein
VQDKAQNQPPPSIEEFLAAASTNKEVDWDGRYVRRGSQLALIFMCDIPRETALLVDIHGRVFAILAGHPDTPEAWNQLQRRLYNELKELRDGSRWTTESLQDRRGTFARRAFGVSYGNGQTVRAPTPIARLSR